ncbi:MAG: DUF2309 domain-containing protein [Pirellulales bacterium]|nr:DUF2309 domain-containing protein [Pirellulales bacterium]
MTHVAASEERARAHSKFHDRLNAVRHALDHASHLLPSQGPISVFVHHNTLHAFEDRHFDEAVAHGTVTYGGEAYLPESRYRAELARGRILPQDLAAVLLEDLDDDGDRLIGMLGTRFQLRLAMLQHPLQQGTESEMRWYMAASKALWHFMADVRPEQRLRAVGKTRHWAMRDLRNGYTRQDPRLQELVGGLFQQFRADDIQLWNETRWEAFTLHLLWRICRQGVESVPRNTRHEKRFVRQRDLLWQVAGQDIDSLVNKILRRFCAAFLDQGLATWLLPHRDEGFFQAFTALYQDSRPVREWMRDLPAELQRLARAGTTPMESIAESLDLLGVDLADMDEYIQATLLALPGWAGMLWQMETNAEWTVHPAPAGTLVGYLAVRLILERLALAYAAQNALGYRGPLRSLETILRAKVQPLPQLGIDRRAFMLFQLAQVRGWSAEELWRLSRNEWTQLVREVDDFSSIERRRIYHLAYERRYRNRALDALIAHSTRLTPPLEQPRFQIVTCIDDREESFRRHLEEVEPACETYSAAGFYGVAMYYRGLADAHDLPLCPVIIKPKHFVREEVAYSFEQSNRRRAETRRVLGHASHRFHLGSRGFLGGVLTAIIGSFASFPLVARVLLPRLTAQISRTFGRFVQPPPITRLVIERSAEPPSPEPGHCGYSVAEMAEIVERILRDIGLTSRLARLIIITGHGSSSLNNPHESAYNCGACSGGRGGPNARAFAEMANDPRVRALMARNGLLVPPEVYFIGAFHNTCDDNLQYHDLDRLPNSHRDDFDHARQVIDEARRRNAHERCRRFESADLTLTPEAALRHVEARSEDLSQARPEYNHASNALCFVGRRDWSRGLFVDRRVFLTSYDPAQDDEQTTILLRILHAAIPVCAGISLEYYFSCVDTRAYGCGSKLPHNITSLLGVMEGAASDLRTGLSQQMIEIHEPVRILFVIETSPEAMLSIMSRHPTIDRLVRGEWVQLALIHPESGSVLIYHHGQFEPYSVESTELPQVQHSIDWYRGWRDHLGFASIEPTPLATRPTEAQS